MKTLLKNGQKFDLYAKREYSFFQFSSFIPCYLNVPKVLVGVETVARQESKNKWGSIYLIKKDMDAVTNHYVQLIEKNIPFLDKEIERLDETGKVWVAGTEKIVKASQKKDANLSDLLKDFWTLLNKHAFSLWSTFIIPEAGNVVLTKLLTRYVNPEFHSEAIIRYSRPSKKAHLLRLAEALSEIDALEKKVQYIKANYPWIFTTDLFSYLPTEDQYIEYANTFKVTNHKESSEKFFPEDMAPIISTCQDIAYLKDHRDEYRRRAFFAIQPLVELIINRFEVTRDDLWHILPDEIDYFEKDRDGILHNITERKIGYVFETDGKKTLSIQGKEAVEDFIQEEKILVNDKVRGIIGAPGKVKGEVQIIKNAEDLKNFKTRNVLVATTTNPDYIAAMQKAVAFVTDEGGLTCHAAIVARELKKPCIIGTKIATKVLKDGDRVEVDADKGIVKIL
jgi:phosphohistidine swiveling domain-containing protein